MSASQATDESKGMSPDRLDQETWRRILADQAWVEDHWSEVAAYAGQWIAVSSGRIVLADPDQRQFGARLRASGCGDAVPYVLRVPTTEELQSAHPAAHPL